MKRTLTLRVEHVADLTTDELASVAGGDWSGASCPRLICPTVLDPNRCVLNGGAR